MTAVYTLRVRLEATGRDASEPIEMGTKNIYPKASKVPKISYLWLNEFNIHCTPFCSIKHFSQ